MQRRMHQSKPKQVKIGGRTQTVMQVIETNNSTDAVDIYIYDQIQPDGMDWWTGETVESQTSADFVRKTLEAVPKAEQINLFVNSVGGDVMEAMGMRALLLRHQAKKTGYVDGWACSAATFLLMACDEVYMIPGSMQFIHDMWTIAAGNAAELRQIADDLDVQQASNREIYMERIGDRATEEQLTEMMAKETWLSAAESVELGLADAVLASDDYKQVLADRAARGQPPSAGLDAVAEITAGEINPQQAVEPDEDTTEDKEPVSMLAGFLMAIEAKEESR